MIGVVNVKSSCINIIPERALSVKVKLYGSQSQHGKLHRNEMWKKVASLKHMGIVFMNFPGRILDLPISSGFRQMNGILEPCIANINR